jgi:transposase InsO family protein
MCDFLQDPTADGRRLRILIVVDEFTRESIAIRVERRMPAAVVIEVLREAFWGTGPRRNFAHRGALGSPGVRAREEGNYWV